MADFYTAQVRAIEHRTKGATELARVEAERAAVVAKEETERAVRLAEAQSRGQEALLKAEADLIRARAEHADSEALVRSHARSLEQLRQQGLFRMVAMASCAAIVIVLLLRC